MSLRSPLGPCFPSDRCRQSPSLRFLFIPLWLFCLPPLSVRMSNDPIQLEIWFYMHDPVLFISCHGNKGLPWLPTGDPRPPRSQHVRGISLVSGHLCSEQDGAEDLLTAAMMDLLKNIWILMWWVMLFLSSILERLFFKIIRKGEKSSPKSISVLEFFCGTIKTWFSPHNRNIPVSYLW